MVCIISSETEVAKQSEAVFATHARLGNRGPVAAHPVPVNVSGETSGEPGRVLGLPASHLDQLTLATLPSSSRL